MDEGFTGSLWEYNGGTNQQWIFARVNQGEFKITVKHSGKALTVQSTTGGKVVSIVQSEWKGNDSQI